MEEVIADLDLILTMSAKESFSDANAEVSAPITKNNSSREIFDDSASGTMEKVLEVCQEQSYQIRQLNQENLRLWNTVKFYSTQAKLERQLQMALREKRWLEEDLDKVNSLLEENRSKLLVGNRKLEQMQAKYNELKERFDAFKRNCTCHRCLDPLSNFCQAESMHCSSSKLDDRKDSSLTNNGISKQYEQQVTQKNKEIKEISELSQKQAELILKQGQQISNLQDCVEQLSDSNTSVKEENPIRTFFRKSFSFRRKKATIVPKSQ